MWKITRLFILYPLISLSSCHLLMTGSPIPLWHIEELRSPVAVRRVTAKHLELADGRAIRLPFIREIPYRESLFRAALHDGVEVNDDGEVYALMWHDRICGNDPVAWKKLRINLTDLAAALNAKSLDDTIVSIETIDFIAEHKQIKTIAAHSHEKGHLSGFDRVYMDSIRRSIEASIAGPDAEAE